MLSLQVLDCFRKISWHSRLLSQILLFPVLLTLTLLFVGEVHAAELTLKWNPNTEPDLAGYKIYYGTNVRDYQVSIDVGKITSHTIANLDERKVHYFAATAYNKGGNESDYSEEVVYDTSKIDSDGDGIVDYDEKNIYGTDPSKSDTDRDGINDNDELAFWAVNWNGDHDADGIINLLDSDSDGDGFQDGFEIANGHDPLNQNSHPSSASTSIYEDAKDGTISGWSIYDKTPSGANISNVFDQDLQINVIQLSGSRKANGYQLRNEDNSKWRNTNQFVIEWSMNYFEPFKVYIDLKTTAGKRYVTYTEADSDDLGSGKNVHHGLGANAINGQWHTFTRDLQADLHAAQPDVDILEVNGILIRGSGRVNNIKLHEHFPKNLATVYENAEDGKTTGWSIYDKTPSGADISNVFDQDLQINVIQLSGSLTDNGYQLRNEDNRKWGNTNQFVIEWSMNYSKPFKVFIDLETSAGHRYVYYTEADSDGLGSGKYVHHGLGANSINGEWHTFARDLQADLHATQPDVDILEVNGFLIRGSGRVNNIKLRN